MLTEHQNEKMTEALEALETEDIILIKGSAGVGKTYMVSALVNELKKKYGDSVMITAPTNKAVQVLDEKLTEFNKQRPKRSRIGTIHSALKLTRGIDKRTGKFFYGQKKGKKDSVLEGIRILIVDEASMISSEVLKHIIEQCTRRSLKVVFVGDSKQINPVNEEDSPVFTKDYPTIELTEIIRQGENSPIIDLSLDLSRISMKEDNIKNDEGYTFTDDAGKIIRSLAEFNGSDDLKFIAYTNERVDQVNAAVRESIYTNPKKIEEGETLYFNEPFAEGDYKTDEELEVEILEVVEKYFYYTSKVEKGISTTDKILLKVYSINPEFTVNEFTGKVSREDLIYVIHEDSEEDLEKILKVLLVKAKKYEIPWHDYYEFLEQFADLRYAHALTIHKSQGSSYKNVIIDTESIKFCRKKKEKERLLYTAVTRASKMVILYSTKI